MNNQRRHLVTCEALAYAIEALPEQSNKEDMITVLSEMTRDPAYFRLNARSHFGKAQGPGSCNFCGENGKTEPLEPLDLGPPYYWVRSSWAHPACAETWAEESGKRVCYTDGTLSLIDT
jgi:hypothetical protein